MSGASTRLGLLAWFLTAAALALAAFGPATFRYPPPGAEITASASLWNQSAIGPGFGVFVLVMVGASLALVLGAALRERGGGSWLTWLGLVALSVGAVVTLPGISTVVTPSGLAATIPDSMGIGVYFVPAVLAGLLTAVVGAMSRAQADRPTFA